MRLVCFQASGQGLIPREGTNWEAGGIDAGLSSMDDRTSPDGQRHFAPGWYTSLTVRKIPFADDAVLRRVLAQTVRPPFNADEQIMELDAQTAAGQVKQEFIISPANLSASHGIRLLMNAMSCAKAMTARGLSGSCRRGPSEHWQCGWCWAL